MIQSFAPAVDQTLRIVQREIVACVGQFYRSFTCNMLGQSQGLLSIAYAGRLSAVKAYFGRFTAVVVRSCYLDSHWPGFLRLSFHWCYGLSGNLRDDCLILSLLLDPEFPLSRHFAVQRLYTGTGALYDGFLHPGQRKMPTVLP